MTRNFKPFQLLPYLLLAAFVIVLLSSPLAAQDAPVEPEESEESDSDIFKAPVIIDGDMLFFLRGSSALPAPERAESVQENIIEVAEASDNPEVDIVFKETELGIQIQADGKVVSIVRLCPL